MAGLVVEQVGTELAAGQVEVLRNTHSAGKVAENTSPGSVARSVHRTVEK